MAQLSNMRVAVIATDGFEEVELTEPVQTLKDAGATVEIISNKSGPIQAFRHMDKGITVPADKTLNDISPNDYDAVLLPGGALNADKIRVEPKLKTFLQRFQNAGKPMAVICHAPWELISAGLAKGRTLTSYYTIQDDVRNAGGNWVDQEVCVDGNLVTSRQPSDIPAFNREMIALFSRTPATVR
ncbi:MAG TPA: type 1 glutamine amidotransferase domain-containing protein [Chloroflexota bacterium]